MDPATLLVDGWNILLGLLHRERTDPDRTDLRRAGLRITLLLDQWAALRGRDVVVAWDGETPRELAAGRGAVRSVFLTPPAEADDWIVEEARRLTGEGCAVAVATADRGLIRRLPRSAELLSPAELAADLEALAGGPVSAPHVGDPSDALVPVGGEAIDTRRLPRRHASVTGTLPGPPAHPHLAAPSSLDRASTPPDSASAAAARAAAARRKEQRRKRHARRRSRRRLS